MNTRELTPILPSSKSTFEWYTDNLIRLSLYGISQEDRDKLDKARADIYEIINKLPIAEKE